MAGTVTVACKLPNGLHADLMDAASGRPIKRVTFIGSAAARSLERADDKGNPVDMEPLSIVRGGFGLTHNVPADFWEAWLAQNADYEPVRKGLIFASAKGDSARDQANDQAEIRNGFEPIDPTKPTAGITPLDRVN